MGEGALPTSVAVPGGFAFLTSSLDRLNTCFNEVIAANAGYQTELAGEPRWKQYGFDRSLLWEC